MKLTPITASAKTSFRLPITIIHGNNKIIPASEGSWGTLVPRRPPKEA
jgi:hypothetical protein